MSSPVETPRPLAIPGAHKIRSEHLTKTAFTYVRQSSPIQVQLRKESQRRQYGLAETLVALGWPREQVVVIDDDQGHSGADKHGRPGFQRLVSEVALGHVGIVLGIETSRLARNSEDWQHLLNLCGVMDTLIGDSEGIYDLRIHNDRMLLGLKGTLSEYELHLLQQRMIDGAAYKARRGELYFTLPAGYVLSEDNHPELHPDEEVRAAISEIFRSFRETGNALETYQELRAAGVRYPSRGDPLARRPVQWSPLVYHHVQRALTNPFLAGAYTWGRRHKVVLVQPSGGMKKVWRQQPLAKCPIVLWDHHPGYITREEFERIQERLTQNRRSFNTRGPVKNGASILAGLIKCGVCGHTLSVHYGGIRSRFPYYTCRATLNEGPRKPCLRFGGRALEERVETVLLSVLEPEGIEAVLLALEDLEARQDRQKRLWNLEVERAAEVEVRCRRKFEEVEPGNRLVSRRLEEKWEESMKILEESRQTRERRIAQLPPPLTEPEKTELRRVVAQVGKLWAARTTTHQDRKEITRLLIHHVETSRTPGSRYLDTKIHWVSGHTTSETVKLHVRGRPKAEIKDSALQMIQRMASDYTDREIARSLTMAGKVPEPEPRWSAWRVKQIRKERGWEKRPKEERESISLMEARKILGITKQTVAYWIKHGKLRSRQAYPNTRHRILREDVMRLRTERKRLGMKGGHQGGPARGL